MEILQCFGVWISGPLAMMGPRACLSSILLAVSKGFMGGVPTNYSSDRYSGLAVKELKLLYIPIMVT